MTPEPTPEVPRPNLVFTAVYLLLMVGMGGLALKGLLTGSSGDNTASFQYNRACSMVICVALSIQATLMSFNPRMLKVAYFSLAAILFILGSLLVQNFRH